MAILVPIAFLSNELHLLNDSLNMMKSEFCIVNLIAGVIGFGLNIASFHCIQHTSALTYSIIGALNKIPLLFIGQLVFDYDLLDHFGVLYLCTTVLGGVIYVCGKYNYNKEVRKK